MYKEYYREMESVTHVLRPEALRKKSKVFFMNIVSKTNVKVMVNHNFLCITRIIISLLVKAPPGGERF